MSLEHNINTEQVCYPDLDEDGNELGSGQCFKEGSSEHISYLVYIKMMKSRQRHRTIEEDDCN